MKNVDDITFTLFVNNSLTQKSMSEVEEALMKNGEIDAAIKASIINHSVNRNVADDMLGLDDVQYSENNTSGKDRISFEAGSIGVNNGSLTNNEVIMSEKLTKEEILKIQDLIRSFEDFKNPEKPLEDNLADFYLNECPGTFPEDAIEIVRSLKSGVETFNSSFRRAMEDNAFDYSSELKNISADMSLKERYELYINFLAALETISVENLSEEQKTQIENYEEIRSRIYVKGEVSEEMVEDVESKIANLIDNNTLCLGSVEALKHLIAELPNGSDAIGQITLSENQGYREKLVASMATYIAYQNGDIESLRNLNLSPESIAISTSAGIEEMNVLSELGSGKTTVDNAIKILKIIGGVALFALLAYASVVAISAIGVLISSLFMGIWGASTIATIGALAISLFCVYSLTNTAVDVGASIMKISSRLFDMVVGVWRETAWPAIKSAIQSTVNWFSSLFNKKSILVQDENSNVNVSSAVE